MFIKDISFIVGFSSCAEKYYCKDFLKKYKVKQWIETKKTIISTLERCYKFQSTNLIDNLKFSQEDGVGIFKLDFRVAGTNVSSKSSGNRAVFCLCNNTGDIKILLVYGKNHCGRKGTETQWILEHIKTNFSELKKYCK
ncbi:MAG: hypothetical protein GWP15_03975 [Nitrospirae bacterium]|nr:hypothetical protein [Nitrospirota bacterium]